MQLVIDNTAKLPVFNEPSDLEIYLGEDIMDTIVMYYGMNQHTIMMEVLWNLFRVVADMKGRESAEFKEIQVLYETMSEIPFL